MPGWCTLSCRTRNSGFSLLEVLIILAVLVLLMAILLPSMARARDQARGTQCLSNLSQQGVASFMYAYERGGNLPSPSQDNTAAYETTQVFTKIPRSTARSLSKMISRAGSVFYCPAARTPTYQPGDFDASVASPPTSPMDAQILYWWLANPTPDAASRFLDADGDGSVTDEYLRRVDARRISSVAISTDQSRQENPSVNDGRGWYFVHGGQGLPRNMVDTRGLTAWKNNLYGDGHAALVHAADVIPRWGPGNRAGW
jgi:type II secretory pathway pseudopilin PulG